MPGEPGTNGVSGYQVVSDPEEATIPAKENVFLEPEVACPAGKVLLGGGATTSALGLLFYDGPAEPHNGKANTWLVVYLIENPTETSHTVDVAAYAYCASAH